MINILFKIFSIFIIFDMPFTLSLSTFQTEDKSISVEDLKSENFVQNDYVNTYSKNGIVWIETEIPEDVPDKNCDIIGLGPENVYEVTMYIQDAEGKWNDLGKTGIGLPLNEKSIPSAINSFVVKGSNFRTDTYRSPKIRFKIITGKESLFEAYLMNSRTFTLLNSLYSNTTSIFIGFCIITIVYILFCSITFQDTKALILLGVCTCLLILILFESGYMYAYILPSFFKNRDIYKIFYILLCTTSALICTQIHKTSKLVSRTFPEWNKKFVNGTIYFYVSVATVCMFNLFLPLSYQLIKFIGLLSFTACFACEIMYSLFSYKFNKSMNRTMLLCFNIALGLLWLKETFTIMRFISGTSAVFRFFDNATFIVPVFSFILIGISTLIRTNRQIRDNLAYLQINTAEAKEKIINEKKRSYVYNSMASMLANPLQSLNDTYEKAKDLIPASEAIAFQQNIQYASKIIKAISTISTYEHDLTELDVDKEPVDLSNLISESISSDISTLRLNGCYTNIQENYTDGSYVIANKELLSISIRFLLQAVVNKIKPKSTVQISSEYEKLTFIFTISFECEQISIELTRLLLDLENENEKNESISQLTGKWGIQLFVAKRIINILSGKLILTPTSNGISIQIRIALKPYVPENDLQILYNIDEFDEEEETQTFIFNEKPKYDQTAFIVEEDQQLRSILQERLKHICNLKFFATNIDFAKAVETEKPDLILYSLSVPGKNLSEILERYPYVTAAPFIVSAKYISRKTSDRLFELGVMEIIQKPYLVSTLAQKIESILRSRGLYLEKILKSITTSFRESIYNNNSLNTEEKNSRISLATEKKPDFSDSEIVEAENTAIFTSAGLTKKEMNIAALVAEGKTDKEIAAELEISTGTVAVHNKNIYKKLKIHSRTELMEKLHK